MGCAKSKEDVAAPESPSSSPEAKYAPEAEAKPDQAASPAAPTVTLNGGADTAKPADAPAAAAGAAQAASPSPTRSKPGGLQISLDEEIGIDMGTGSSSANPKAALIPPSPSRGAGMSSPTGIHNAAPALMPNDLSEDDRNRWRNDYQNMIQHINSERIIEEDEEEEEDGG